MIKLSDIKVRLKKIINILRFIFTPLAILFLIYYSWQSFDSLAHIFRSIAIESYLIAVGIWLVLHLLMPVLSLVYLNAEEKKELKYSDALFIYANRLPARYIPGGVWHSVSRGVDFHSFGMDINQIGRYFIIENVISLSMALLLGGILITLGQNYNLPVSIMLSFASLGLIMLLLLPVMLNRYFSHKDIKISEITIAQTVKGVLLTGAFWMIAGICFWQYILGFPISMDGLSYLDIAGSYIFSWAIGFIVIFAPQGIGITEFVATNIINVNVDLNVYLILVLGFRLVILSADLIMWSFIKLFLSKPINN